MSTNAPQWMRVRQILEDALEKPEPERTRFISAACGNDTELYREVTSLLASTEEASTFIEQPPDWLAAEAVALQPGTQLDHYRIVSLLGRGGMGDVYLAEDRELDRRVALKFLAPEVVCSSERLQRFEQEARAASALSHPNIVTIHGIRRVESGPFLVTEYVDGRTLRQQIAEGPLDLMVAIDEISQIAAALSAAHAAGITHRDLKPENVMIRRDGLIKLLDFGLARRDGAPSVATPGRRGPGLTDPGTVMGTASYMSPEQARGLEVGPQSDLFSLGALLYEVVTGERPFQGSNREEVLSSVLTQTPRPMAALRPGVPGELQAIADKLLCKDTAGRYATVDDVIADLKALHRRLESWRAPRSVLRSPWLIAAAALLAVAIAGAAIVFLRPSAGLTDTDFLLLASFDNQTGDPGFDNVLEQALAVQLEQSPFLSIFPEERVRETLRLMKQPDIRVSRDVGLEISRRQGVKVVLAGSIHALGNHYAIGLDAIAAETGNVVAREQAEAPGKEGVLTALAQTASRMRGKLGESLPSIQRFDAPIEQATTASLEALKAYNLGFQLANRGQGIAAIPLYRRAVQLDPEFALAWSQLANAYSSAGQHPEKIAAGERAFALRERVSEREQFHIESDYYTDVTREPEKAVQVYLLWAKTYPRDGVPVSKLGSRYLSLGRYEAAVEQLRTALRLYPDSRALIQNLARALLRLNRFDEAAQVLQSALQRQIDTPQMRQTRFDLAFVRNDGVAMQQAVSAARGDAEDEYDRTFDLGEVAAFGGRFKAAEEFFASAAALAVGHRRPPQFAGWALARIASSQAWRGRCDEALASVSRALAISKYQGVVRMTIWPLVHCGRIAEAQRLLDEVARAEPQDDGAPSVGSLDETQALILLASHQPERALELLPALPYEPPGGFAHTLVGSLGRAWVRAQALLEMKNGAAAAAEFRRIIDNRGGGPKSTLWPLAHLGLARALVFTGALDESRARYQQFLELWKDADPDATDLMAAKREHRDLTDGRD